MGRKNKCKKLGFSAILWVAAVVMLSAVPCAWAQMTVPEGQTWNIPTEHPNPTSGNIVVEGTANLLYGASIPESVIVKVGGTLNLHLGADITQNLNVDRDSNVNIYGGNVGGYINISPELTAPAPVVTVYGTEFEIIPPTRWGSATLSDTEITPGTDGWWGTLSGKYEDLSVFVLEISSDTPINLSAPSANPEQMLIDLRQYILDQVYPPEGIEPGIDAEMEVSLLAKVDAASDALERGNPNDAKVAMNDMKALVNQVLAQTNKKISIEASGCIQADADAIIAALGG